MNFSSFISKNNSNFKMETCLDGSTLMEISNENTIFSFIISNQTCMHICIYTAKVPMGQSIFEDSLNENSVYQSKISLNKNTDIDSYIITSKSRAIHIVNWGKNNISIWPCDLNTVIENFKLINDFQII
jgi:hypothetical protein